MNVKILVSILAISIVSIAQASESNSVQCRIHTLSEGKSVEPEEFSNYALEVKSPKDNEYWGMYATTKIPTAVGQLTVIVTNGASTGGKKVLELQFAPSKSSQLNRAVGAGHTEMALLSQSKNVQVEQREETVETIRATCSFSEGK